MSSNPVLRDMVVAKLREVGPVTGASLGEIRENLGLERVTNTQFGAALGSLAYSPQHRDPNLSWCRFWPDIPAQTRHHALQVVG